MAYSETFYDFFPGDLLVSRLASENIFDIDDLKLTVKRDFQSADAGRLQDDFYVV